MVTSVKVGPIRYSVAKNEDMTRDGEYNGRARFNDSLISLATNLDSQVERQVLWHEIVHVILTQGKIEHDERITDVLAYGIMQVLQDNPEMRRGNGEE